ncbi:hybrid sensor histidine kinase/response regulator [Flavobacterium amnicola]|uniref:histidine kinase n=1 Tax=Flavobacterium amnicola TaxID=2506422 RepID=A0A4Q1K5Y8_9FLAO|nr:hybrid sensor histidine kinase/response regulator [Flavobacterium amnicola]RXR20930.1 hybrid sensor histidine kinase/response regulator [Flavobacterium amnicola]
MKNWYDLLVSLGIRNTIQSNSEIKRIKLFNTFCYCWYATAVILLLNYLTKSPLLYLNILVHFLQLIVIILSQYIHTKGHYEIGRFMFALMLIVNSFVFGNFIKKGQLLEFYLILAPAVSLVLTDNKKINYSIFTVALLCFTIPNHFFEHYPTIDFYSPGLVCLFFLFYILTNYFKKQNNQIEKLLELERDKVIADKIILEEQRNKLDQLNEFKSHFFVNFSHEIRTPLTLIQGNVSRINLKGSLEENQGKIENINNQVAQIQNIINNIIDLSKIDSNEFTITCTKVALQPFLEKHYAEFATLFQKKEIQFDLIMTVSNIAVFMDEDLMSKSINNLLSNALKFTPKKGRVAIEVTLEKDLILKIKDTGIGIPASDVDKVFERFFQSKNDITKSQGSGIGLSFTQSILEAHHFDISLSSIPNEETIFTITIPKKAIEHSPIVLKTSNTVVGNNRLHKIQTQPSKTTKRSILIVEDNEQMRHYLKEVLEDYHITEAENGQEALEILQQHSFDIIITDYMMPVLDGEGLVLQIKEQELKTPIIVLTARSDQEGKLNMLRLGIDGYLNKPFVEEELLLMIQKSLQSFDTLHTFVTTLDAEERESLTVFASKFNVELNELIYTYLHSHTFGVEDIALHMNISKSTLNRKTKAILGQTTQELIMEARFQKAKALLMENPHATKKEIAASVGITNATYFFSKLKERFGTSV